MRDLATMFGDAEEEAAILDANKATFATSRVRELLREFRAAAADYITWISEREAMIRSGHKEPWLRKQFPTWERMGHAKLNDRGQRLYLRLIVPLRSDDATIRAAAAHAAQESRGMAS